LNVRAETLLQFAGLYEDSSEVPSVEESIAADLVLTDKQKMALLGVYRGFLDAQTAP